MDGREDTHVIAVRMDHEPGAVALGLQYTDAARPMTAAGVLTYGWQLSAPMALPDAMVKAEQLIKNGEATEAHVLECTALFTRSFDVQKHETPVAGFFGRTKAQEEREGRALGLIGSGEAERMGAKRLQPALRPEGGRFAQERAEANQPLDTVTTQTGAGGEDESPGDKPAPTDSFTRSITQQAEGTALGRAIEANREEDAQ